MRQQRVRDPSKLTYELIPDRVIPLSTETDIVSSLVFFACSEFCTADWVRACVQKILDVGELDLLEDRFNLAMHELLLIIFRIILYFFYFQMILTNLPMKFL